MRGMQPDSVQQLGEAEPCRQGDQSSRRAGSWKSMWLLKANLVHMPNPVHMPELDVSNTNLHSDSQVKAMTNKEPDGSESPDSQ